DALWARTLELNLVVPFVLTRLVVKDMLEAGHGRIVHLASTASLKGYAYTSAYSASKHGLLGLARAQSLEWAPRGVTVNCVCPGFVDTELTASAARAIAQKTGRSVPEVQSELAKENPLGRLIRPEEVAEAVAGFLGPHGDAVTGQALVVAGGAVQA
ncbi:MAG: SDR family oxidoreductase, partial [Planctomycetes bacterium]|nr:SDR family oxidoreductase [Planctomycetota bacterium]